MAALLGRPLMEWQQYVADVLLEVQSEAAGDPHPGELAYSEYTLLTPRQSGKTVFILAKASHRASATSFFGSAQVLTYTAQTAKKAVEKFERDYAVAVKNPRARRLGAHSRTGNSKVDIRYRNDSVFGVESATEKAGHGSTLDEAYIDEAFAQQDNRLEQAFRPAMITRRNKQLGRISTAGWLDASPYLYPLVEQGRALVASGVRLGTAYFEWSAEDDADPSSPAVWLACMPALHRPDCPPGCKRHTVTLSAVQAEFDAAQRSGKLSDFRRAYLNQWRRKPRAGDETMLGNWNAGHVLALPEGEERDAVLGLELVPAAIGISADRDRTRGCIGAALPALEDGRIRVGLVDRREGVDWLVARALELQRRYGCAVVLDEKGPIGDLADDFEAAGVALHRGTLNEYFAACGDVYDGVQTAQLLHEGQGELDEAVESARWRDVGDRRVFGRKASEDDIAPLEAVTWALWWVKGGYDPLDSVY